MNQLPPPIGHLQGDLEWVALNIREKMTRGVTVHSNNEKLRVFAQPHGAVSLLWEYDPGYESVADRHPDWIVGTYIRTITRQQLCTDLRAMRKAFRLRRDESLCA